MQHFCSTNVEKGAKKGAPSGTGNDKTNWRQYVAAAFRYYGRTSHSSSGLDGFTWPVMPALLLEILRNHDGYKGGVALRSKAIHRLWWSNKRPASVCASTYRLVLLRQETGSVCVMTPSMTHQMFGRVTEEIKLSLHWIQVISRSLSAKTQYPLEVIILSSVYDEYVW